jgi:hypothetical protein
MLVSWQARVAANVVGRPRHVACGHRVFASLSVDPDHRKDIDRIMELAKKSVDSWEVQVCVCCFFVSVCVRHRNMSQTTWLL